MKNQLKLIVLAIIAMLSSSAHAQLFFHKDGFYEKTNNHWTEYQITKEDNDYISEFKEVGKFDEQSSDENYYYVNNDKYMMAIPKNIGGTFYSHYPNQEEWTELYIREEFQRIKHSIKSEYEYKTFIIYDDGKAMLRAVFTDYPGVDIPDKIYVNGKSYTVDKLNGYLDGDNLERVTIPNSVCEIIRLDTSKDSTKKLKEIVIPGSVEKIGDKAPFGYDSNIETIVLKGTDPMPYSLYFRDMPNLKTIVTYRPIEGAIWVTGSKKFKNVKNFSGREVVVRTYLDKEPKYF